MADRLHVFDVTVPALTFPAAPLTTDLPIAEGRIVTAALTFPAGCAGLVGVHLSYGGRQVIPVNESTQLRGNGIRLVYEMHNYPTGNQWRLVAYNTDAYDHTVTVEFEINEFSTGELSTITFLPAEVIS